MNTQIIDTYISLSLAIKVLQLDRDKFTALTAATIYLDKIDAIIEQAKKDFYMLKRDLITEHHIEIKKISGLKYSVAGEVHAYTSDELKEMTEKIVLEYLMRVEFEPRKKV